MQITKLKTVQDYDDLGIVIPARVDFHTIYGITVNISPKCSVDVNHLGFCFRSLKGILMKRYPWGKMTSREQYTWFKWYIAKVIAPECDQGMFITAMTQKGEVHLHGYVVLHESLPRNNPIAMIADFRKQIARNPIVRNMTNDNTAMARHLNYIHELVNFGEWKTYMQAQIVYKPLELTIEDSEESELIPDVPTVRVLKAPKHRVLWEADIQHFT